MASIPPPGEPSRHYSDAYGDNDFNDMRRPPAPPALATWAFSDFTLQPTMENQVFNHPHTVMNDGNGSTSAPSHNTFYNFYPNPNVATSVQPRLELGEIHHLGSQNNLTAQNHYSGPLLDPSYMQYDEHNLLEADLPDAQPFTTLPLEAQSGNASLVQAAVTGQEHVHYLNAITSQEVVQSAVEGEQNGLALLNATHASAAGPQADYFGRSVIHYGAERAPLSPNDNQVAKMLKVLPLLLGEILCWVVTSDWYQNKEAEQVPEKYKSILAPMPTTEMQRSIFSVFLESKQVKAKQRYLCYICNWTGAGWEGDPSPTRALGHVRKVHFNWCPSDGFSNETTKRDVNNVRAKNAEKPKCDVCGANYTYQNWVRHTGTKKHRLAEGKKKELKEKRVDGRLPKGDL